MTYHYGGCYALGTSVIHQTVCYPKRYICTILARGCYALGTCVLHYGGYHALVYYHILTRGKLESTTVFEGTVMYYHIL